MNTYCPHCNSHHEHELEKVREGRPSGLTKVDSRQRQRQTGIGNDGKFSEPPKRSEKTSSKTHIKYICSNCGKAHQRAGFRAGRIEFTE